MKQTSIPLLITFVVLALIFIQAGTSAAYNLVWADIQFRVYESGDTKNKLAFGITDNSGNYVNSTSAVTGVTLKYPNGDPVNSLSSVELDPLWDHYPARFDSASSSWVYLTPGQYSEFYFYILDPLVTGNYAFEVSMENGQKLTDTINFDLLVSLPIISSRTFQIQTDSAGNLYWTWDIPEQLLTMHQTYDLIIKAGVVAQVSGKTVSLYWPTIPVEMGSSFVPSSIYQNLVSAADEIFFSLHVRDSEGIVRAYSNPIWLKDLSTPVSISPRKTAVVIPLMD